ncbi:hypothetical protein [Hymenobacter crusticola]|uniref:Uncharacterized protein n=1 Tax=Hymenobacter crusticola TaxID=1770526 RepID=A0A243W7Y7_9BACT|nr:hypothetical protein [Hymenobacter crusticola]OUJ68813.1 hypothetical protein BXP70_27335 [Hymenobacter crusticola]
MEQNNASLDLDQIHLVEALFMECVIQDTGHETFSPYKNISPDNIAEYDNPDILILPSYDLENQLITFKISVKVAALDSESKPVGVQGSFTIFLAFRVLNLQDLLIKIPESDHMMPNAQVGYALIAVAYSTARGMIMSKISDTVLQGFALPLRSVQQLMKEALALARKFRKDEANEGKKGPKRGVARTKKKEEPKQ